MLPGPYFKKSGANMRRGGSLQREKQKAASASQGARPEQTLPSWPSGDTSPAEGHLATALLPGGDTLHFCFSSHAVCGALLRQAQETSSPFLII